MASIAVVGMACRYPGADSPEELWENVLAQRQAFRRIPDERLNAADYVSPDESSDRTYSGIAAVIEGYQFDRARFRVSGDAFRSADLAHWLALDVAAEALADAGYAEAVGLPRESAGVFIGNTLTGEFSRAGMMRLRWPYVRRVVDAALSETDWPEDRRARFIGELEVRYKSPFPEVGDESLAGALSNTIAGRICNYFDLNGGGYTVDGACASSLLATANACSALAAGDVDIALAGGVDLSLDPLELVGFAQVGALAREEMRVYDARCEGFWPGEGCGMVVLMRHEDALAGRRRIYAAIRGWGISSDGAGGLTRPKAEGQMLALRRAYQRAGFGIESVEYFEGHGTGTSAGDTAELTALINLRQSPAPAAAIGSVKALIGHTKAAAGAAGLIKAALALHHRIVPPTVGCREPHPLLTVAQGHARRSHHPLRVLSQGELWPQDRPLRAAVSGMGFGGINAHIVLEGDGERREVLSPREETLLSSTQDAELLLFSAETREDLIRQIGVVLNFCARLSRSELTDLAAELARGLEFAGVRAAVVASTPEECAANLEALKASLSSGEPVLTGDVFFGDAFFGENQAPPRIGFLFPGQGSPTHLDGGIWRRRFRFVDDLYKRAPWDNGADGTTTAVAQPAVATAGIAALRALTELGIDADLATGHSLGELAALHWAGAMDEEALRRIAVCRGAAMGRLNGSKGAMAAIAADAVRVRELLNGSSAVIAGINSPRQTVISGMASAVAAVARRARAEGLEVHSLPVSHAFHSILMEPAARPLSECLARENILQVGRSVFSTVTGGPLSPDSDLRALIAAQLCSPVRFADCIAAAGRVDFWIEAGPGNVLAGLMQQLGDAPVISLDACGPSIRGLLRAAGMAFAAGVPIRHRWLFENRFSRPFSLDWSPRFFANPCESAPRGTDLPVCAPSTAVSPTAFPAVARDSSTASPVRGPADRSAGHGPAPRTIDVIRRLVAERAELPAALVRDDSRLLSDLHLNSIVVSGIVAAACRQLGSPVPLALTEYADASIEAIAQAIESPDRTAPADIQERFAPGVSSWIRAFEVVDLERPLETPRRMLPSGPWKVFAPANYPWREALDKSLAKAGGGGVALALPPDPDESAVPLLLESARAVLGREWPNRFALVQHGGGAASFARTQHLETPGLTTCVVDVPPDLPQAWDWLAAEVAAASEYSEARYDAAGTRRQPYLKLASLENAAAPPLTSADLLLVTGGGKGIGAESALALARQTGARIALIGRSQPDQDPELAQNLQRMSAAGVQAAYFAADVTDAAAVQRAIRGIEESHGPVTAFLHAAGINEARLLRTLDETSFRAALTVKLQGARNVLAAIDPARLRLMVTFGSLIARCGLPGEAHYAVANEWLTRLAERWRTAHPHCRTLALEWSVWSGIGMGERLGRIDSLLGQGITPIPPEEGIAWLGRLLGQRSPRTTYVITGRFGEPPTLNLEDAPLPFRRFLETRKIQYRGVELVVEAEISTGSDPYVQDHIFQGQALFPAVMGLEAMAQTAMALAESERPPVLEDVRFARPITAPATIRVAALSVAADRIEVALRSSETGFQIDHFRAVCSFASQPADSSEPPPPASRISLDPARDLYGGILFQAGAFRRLAGYRKLSARECIAEIDTGDRHAWFSRYLPQNLELGDPGARDAVLHSIQGCIPHRLILPAGVDRLRIFEQRNNSPCFSHAVERSHAGDEFVYDVNVFNADDSPRERWEGLRLRAVDAVVPPGVWPAALLQVYLERRIMELLPDAELEIAITLAQRGSPLLHEGIAHRPDGKPEAATGLQVSFSYSGNLMLRVTGKGRLGCDIEPVAERSVASWLDLLGPSRHALASTLSAETREDFNQSATRLWTVGETLRKAGLPLDAPLTLGFIAPDGWVLFASGRMAVASCVAIVAQARGWRCIVGIGVDA